MNRKLTTLMLALVAASVLRADTHYVAQSGQTPEPPYTNTWSSAASNIQDAVNQAVDADTVLVSNGVYETGLTNILGTNRVAITNAIIVRSLNGPDATSIKGAWDPVTTNGPAAVRCVYMAASSWLIGFTLTNGATTAAEYGGAARGGILSNCVLTGNSAAYGAGTYLSTLFNCAITRNYASLRAGASYSSTLSNCTIAGNSSLNEGGALHSSTLYNCMIVSNTVLMRGGGAYRCTLYGCTLVGNRQTSSGTSGQGGGVCGGNLYNCLVAGNEAAYRGGGADAFIALTNYNCTFVGNKASASGGGGGVAGGVMYNCIVYSNSPANWTNGVFINSCTFPSQTNWTIADGNITNEPVFIAPGTGYGTNHVAGNYHLNNSSPCMDAGTNFPWMTDSNDARGRDRDGGPRVRYNRVDMGCYEIIFDGTRFAVY